jgi:hypothetical protein
MPHWSYLRDVLLLGLMAADGPQQRRRLVRRAIADHDWPAGVRDQPALGTAPTHRSHLGERMDATIDRMRRQDGLIERPDDRRGYYVLTTPGRHAARRLRGGPSVRYDGKPVAKRSRQGFQKARQNVPRSGANVPRPGDASWGQVPDWLAGFPIGSWRPYRPPRSVRSTAPEPFTWDADEKDAHTREHADVLTRLAEVLVEAGCPPVEGRRGRLACDLLFRTRGGEFVIVEAKSLPAGSDDHQLRIGIGQLVQYRSAMAARLPTAPRAVLAVPRAPVNFADWRQACRSVDIELRVVTATARGLGRALLGGTDNGSRRRRPADATT